MSRTRLLPDERRRLILDAAIEAFRDAEYSEVSLDDVSRRAGVTRGLVHHYFGSKRGLYRAVVEQLAALASQVPLVPTGLTGSLEEDLDACVRRWLDVAEAAGGIWLGTGGSTLTRSDVDDVIRSARDVLVERIAEELPLPPSLDPALLRSALRTYAAVASVATDEWLVHASLTRAQTHALLRETLAALIDRVVPAMQAADPAPATRPG